MSGRPPSEKDDPLEDPPTISELPRISDSGPVAPAVDQTDLMFLPPEDARPPALRIALNRPVPLKEVSSSVEIQRGRIAQEPTRLLPSAARNQTPVPPGQASRLPAATAAQGKREGITSTSSKEDTEEDLAPDSKTELMMSPGRGEPSMPPGTLSRQDTDLSQPGPPTARLSAPPKSKAPRPPRR